MPAFNGFTSSETFTQIPDSFIRLLQEIDDVSELKVTLYAFWRIEHIEDSFRTLRDVDFEVEVLGLDYKKIKFGLGKAVKRGTLLMLTNDVGDYYFLNSPRGRLTAEAFEKGHWRESTKTISALMSKSNIFRLYEENIGVLTPLLSDMLREAEKDYPSVWFEEAFEIAVSRNIRNWKYVEAILARWKEKGKDERKDKQGPTKDSDRYTDSQFSEFINRD